MRHQLYSYHSTAVDRIPSIRQDGLQPSKSAYRDPIEEDLNTIAAENKISLPINRQDCVFCYPSLSIAVDSTFFKKGTADEESKLFRREAVVVIDVASIRDELYVADFDLFSDAIDLNFSNASDDAIKSDSYESALTTYAESLTKLVKFESIDDIFDTYHSPEILIENGVSGSSIVETILVKRILRTKFN